MLRKKIAYQDFNGVERKEEFWFNLTEAELMELQFGTVGGFEEMVRKIISTQDKPKLMSLFKEIILMSYGIKSDDGRQFIKNAAVRDAFAQTNAYSKLYMELITDEKAAADFINGIVPSNISGKLNKEEYNQKMNELLGVIPDNK